MGITGISTYNVDIEMLNQLSWEVQGNLQYNVEIELDALNYRS